MSTDHRPITRVLTGITTTGTPHLGNYAGAIRPAIRSSLTPGVQSFYFLADLHALIKCDDPARIQRSTLEIAATWLACGLNPEHVVFYRQSDIPEISDLNWLLTCVSSKGMLNRAHAYKAATDKNETSGLEVDADITAGLFMYPVLMAADILAFSAHQVPVGRDQIQHIEMARDIALRFNHLYGADLLTPPQACIEDNVATLPGLDGRKMSKSYNNTIPLFSPPAQLRKLIGSILTDSTPPGQPKSTENSALFQIYQAFATAEEAQALKHELAQGLAWAQAKDKLYERLEQDIAPMRSVYEELIAHPKRLEDILQAGAAKARTIAQPLLRTLRHAVGLRALHDTPSATSTSPDRPRSPCASFKQYREKDGLFYFKLVTAQAKTLLQSQGYATPKEVAQAIAALKQDPENALKTLENQLESHDTLRVVVDALRDFQESGTTS